MIYTLPDGQRAELIDGIIEPDISVICDKNKLNEHGCNGVLNWIILLNYSNYKDLENDFSGILK